MSRPALIDKLCQAGKWLFKPDLVPVDDVTLKRGSTAISSHRCARPLRRWPCRRRQDRKALRGLLPRPRRPDAGHCPRYGAAGRRARR